MPTFEFEDGVSNSANLPTSNILYFSNDGVTFTWSIIGSPAGSVQHSVLGNGRLFGTNSSSLGSFVLDVTGVGATGFSGTVVLEVQPPSISTGVMNVFFEQVGGGTITRTYTGIGTVSATGSFTQIRFAPSIAQPANLTIESLTANITCFVAGTRIATPVGFALVEELAEGDVVSTPEGTTTVRWVGSREVDPRLVRPEMVNPVRIKAGALGNDRDLLVSPDHGVLVDGVLVNASALVNGSTIRQVARREPFTYYHVETDAHELILAEGVPCESYLPEREEFSFDNEASRPARDLQEMDLPRITSRRLVGQSAA